MGHCSIAEIDHCKNGLLYSSGIGSLFGWNQTVAILFNRKITRRAMFGRVTSRATILFPTMQATSFDVQVACESV